MPVPTPPPSSSPLRLAAMRRHEPEPVWAPAGPLDPQCSVSYWNHPCPAPLCTTWVPNHRAACARHEPAEEATA